MKPQIYLIGLNHRTAGVDVRECFALSEQAVQERGLTPESVISLEGPLKETMLLSTCNRVEVLVAAEGPADEAARLVLERWAAARGRCYDDLAPYVYVHEGKEAVEHLFSVASSLDSMVLGEPQILGQLKDAYKKALGCGNTGIILNKLLHRAFSTAKRVRTETGVASSAVSISYAAVELAKRIFGDMSIYRAMLIGAGEMAELAATHLVNSGISAVWVSNRTYSRAVELAGQYKGMAVPFGELFEALAEVDIVISSTGSPEPIIKAKDIRNVLKRRKNRPMFFIDIAVPRDIDPDVNGLDNVYLYDIDDLKEVVEENLSQRHEEAIKARHIVMEETLTFCRWLDELDLQPTIVQLVQRTENIVQEELERTLKRLGPSDPSLEEALRVMLDAMIKKINHAPIDFLKRHFNAEEGTKNIDLIRRVFALDTDASIDDDPSCGGCIHRRRKHRAKTS